MIRQSTAFVLGAGASMAYGFPSGPVLADWICNALVEQNGETTCLCRGASKCGAEDPRLLVELFRASGLYSIDAFLQRRPEFAALGKAAIAATLIPREREESLFGAPAADDWYRYLLNAILPPKAADFANNHLRIVTFNFDRSFERRLFLALLSTYRLTGSEAATLARSVEIVHVHGQLGEPAWLGGSGRPYGHKGPLTDVDVSECANQIHLISDELEDREPLRLARQFLTQSSTICFLGFGYDPLNLARLRIADIELGPIVKQMMGTAYGIPNGERSLIYHNVKGAGRLNLRPAELTILGLLEEHDLIHQP